MEIILIFSIFLPLTLAQVDSGGLACDIIRNKLVCSDFTTEYICDSKGNEYNNHCAFAKAHCDDVSLHISYMGRCVLTTPGTGSTLDPVCQVFLTSSCPQDREPVCVSNNVTYTNLCSFNKEKCKNPALKIVHKGVCDNGKMSTQDVKTVQVTTDEMTTATKDMQVVTDQVPNVKTHHITTDRATTGVTTTTLDPGCQALSTAACPDDKLETCGTDGVTYKNGCFWGKARCIDPGLNIFHAGPCRTMSTPPAFSSPGVTLDVICQAIVQVKCGDQGDKVCDTDGKEYSNQCEFQKDKCYKPTLRTKKCPVLTPLDVVCRTLMTFTCLPRDEPLCGTDGQTYANDCEYEKGKCGNHNLHVKNFGPCKM